MNIIKKVAVVGLAAGALLTIPTAAMASPVEPSSAGKPAAVGAADPSRFGVDLDSPGVVFASNSRVELHGSARGYSAGNWVNVWVREAGTTQWTDLGGAIVNDPADFTIEKRLPVSATKYEIQLSMGAYPNESYSQIRTYTPNYF